MTNQSYRASGALGGTVFFTVPVLVLLVEGIAVATSVSNPVVGLAIILVSLLFLSWSWLLVRRKGVYLDDDGITIRGSFRVRRASWADIEGFSIEVGPFGVVSFLLYLDPGNVRGYVNLRNGSRVQLTGLKPVRRQTARRTREELSRTIDALNETREARNRSGALSDEDHENSAGMTQTTARGTSQLLECRAVSTAAEPVWLDLGETGRAWVRSSLQQGRALSVGNALDYKPARRVRSAGAGASVGGDVSHRLPLFRGQTPAGFLSYVGAGHGCR
jgi:hypothetical protein